MKHVAFFRNLNLGRPNCPSKVQFEEAFIAAGATTASSFLTNGTLVFTTHANGDAHKLLAIAREALRDTCGLREPAYIRTMKYLAEFASLAPFAAASHENLHECCASFLAPECVLPSTLPVESKRGDVKVLQVTGSEVLSLSLKIGKTIGSPNAFLEKHLGMPVTTRSWNTIVRLVQRFA